MEQVTVTTARGVEKTTTLKNGDVLLEVAPPERPQGAIDDSVDFYINSEKVDHQAYQDRLQRG